MSYSDFRDPVRFEPPPPRAPRRFPLWLASALVFLVLIAIAGYFFLKDMTSSFRREMQAVLPPAAVHVGSPLSWRTLERSGDIALFSQGSLGGLYIADFDGDGDDEVLRVHPANSSPLYEVNGGKSTCGIHGLEFMMGGEPWDYDRDGVSEILTETMLGDVMQGVFSGTDKPEDLPLSQELPVYNLKGRSVARLPVVASTPGSLIIGDFDGDGWDDLLCSRPSSSSKYGSSTYVAMGRDGKEVWELTVQGGISFACTGDVDGDGRDELVTTGDRMRGLVFYGKDQQPEPRSPAGEHVSPEACFDVDGDGTEEVVYSGAHVYNPVSTGTTDLKLPPGLAGQSMLKLSAHVVRADILGDAQPEITIAPGNSWSYLLIFDAAGNCLYYEEFGDMVFHLGLAQAGGRDYIVVQCSQQLLIYP
jgi:hypothetical protein